jgi:phosphoribosylaminoimidazolecarboxamide formyltransferase/IMP cyclohydrolase
MPRALLSVSDKTGLLDLARVLHHRGIELVSTGGTAAFLQQAGLPVIAVDTLTGCPEMLDGRVKTLHPKIHGALLARRDLPTHQQALQAHDITPIDVLVVNLYPFESTVAKPGCTLAQAIENIDIGGPAMVRSAAKNYTDVVVLTQPDQYAGFIKAFQNPVGISLAQRFTWAVEAFNHISRYDAAISNTLSALSVHRDQESEKGETNHQRNDAIDSPLVISSFPQQANATWFKVQDLRYGENPHQQAAWYREVNPAPGSLVTAQSLQGKALSFNNLADADAAWECVKTFSRTACVIVKHANPCGVALGDTALQAYQKAHQTDPTSAFGGILAFNTEIDESVVQAVLNQFLEVLIAPAFTAAALSLLATKPNVRVLQIQWPLLPSQEHLLPHNGVSKVLSSLDIKRIGGGVLLQTPDRHVLPVQDFRVVTEQQPTLEQLRDLQFAFQVAQHVKSNAIVFCGQGQTLGIGAGQMSRVDAARIARIKAEQAGLSLQGCVAASDAFFPFRDGLDVLVDAGARAIIQPGGSVRDEEVIAAADERGVVMVLTGVRHFRH